MKKLILAISFIGFFSIGCTSQKTSKSTNTPKVGLTDSSTADTNPTLGNAAGTKPAGGNTGTGATGATSGSGL